MPKYCLGPSRATSDIIDNEAIIVDLDKGIYFSCNGAGSLVWARALEGKTDDSIVDECLSLENSPTRAVVEAEIHAFINELLNHSLIMVTLEDSSLVSPSPHLERYEAPRLQTFDDLQDLIVLDPIHEVTEAGWPQRSK